MTPDRVKGLAHECGFELAGIAAAGRSPDFERFQSWVDGGMAGEISYLTDRRLAARSDPKLLLESARSIICVGKLYNGPQAYSTEFTDPELGWISRYAWGSDYHDVLRDGLELLAERLGTQHEYKVCVDTAPLLERSYARAAGLGWIGKNTCLINEPQGSWFFLGELLTSLEIQPDAPPADRCGTCSRCVEACPTHAISPQGYELDSRLCISHFTIELRNAIPAGHRQQLGNHLFGCDICQDVCPWNRGAPITNEPHFAPTHMTPRLEKLAALSEPEFRDMFRHSPVSRAKYRGFLRNVAIAMGNSALPGFQAPLEKLAANDDPLIREHAQWALARCRKSGADQITALTREQ